MQCLIHCNEKENLQWSEKMKKNRGDNFTGKHQLFLWFLSKESFASYITKTPQGVEREQNKPFCVYDSPGLL